MRLIKKTKQIFKRGVTIEPRKTDCETFQNGYRSSQKISKIQECLHPHINLATQIRNVLRRWVARKHSIYSHFRNDRNCEVGKRTKKTRALCRRRTGNSVPRAEKFGQLITADLKILNEGDESRNNHRYAVVVQDLGTQWIQSFPCKTKVSQETERSSRRFSSHRKSRKSFTLTIHWNLVNPVKICHGIKVLPHFTDLRQMILLKERHAEERKKHLLYCSNQERMKNGELILWNAVAICDMSMTSWQMVKHPLERLRRTIQRPSHSVRSNGGIPSDFCERSVKAPPNW